jgi:hypothetical protein
MAPLEKLVVVRPLALGAGAAVLPLAAFAAAMVVSLAFATWTLVPAAESTHAFMSVSVIRLTLSAFAFAAATVGLAESAADFFGGATNVVNCADAGAGASIVAAENKRAVVT